jgi:nucleotide-binding universal stress UspA family protein
MIKNILVPIDYSQASLNAFETAISIATANNAQLQILHVNDTLPGVEESFAPEKTKGIIDAMAGRIYIQHGIQTKVIFAEGISGQIIVKTAWENKIDLVIMGTHGVSGFRDFIIGSTSYYVIKRASCPVLLIPEGKKWFEFNKILFPVRPSLFSFRLFKVVDDIIKQNKEACKVQILGISTDRYARDIPQLYSMARKLKDKKSGSNTDILFSTSKNINISASVLARVNESKADLIIISPGVDVPSKPFFVGPFSQRIINHANIPVLSILKTSEN